MGLHRAGLEFGVEVAGKEPGMVGQFHDFHELAVRRSAGDDEALFHELFAEGIVELVAVAMAFGSFFQLVGGSGEGVGSDDAGVGAEAELVALVAHIFSCFTSFLQKENLIIFFQLSSLNS